MANFSDPHERMPELRTCAVLNSTPPQPSGLWMRSVPSNKMKVVEEMRRTLREIKDVNKLDSNQRPAVVSTTEQRTPFRSQTVGYSVGKVRGAIGFTNR